MRLLRYLLLNLLPRRQANAYKGALMCLREVTQEFDPFDKNTYIGYRILRKINSELRPLFSHVYGVRFIPRRWYTSSDTRIHYGSVGDRFKDRPTYPSGFHVFARLKDAKTYRDLHVLAPSNKVIARVKVRNITCEGYQTNKRASKFYFVMVAREQLIDKVYE